MVLDSRSKKIKKKTQIIGERIQLMKIKVDHAQGIYELLKSPQVLQYLTINEPNSVDDIRQYIYFLQNQWSLSQDYTFTIIMEHPNNHHQIEIIGQISLYELNYVHQRSELGIWLGAQYWKLGYGKEALNLLIHHAFEDLCINRLQAHIFLENRASQKLFEGFGFQMEGIARQYVLKDNIPYDVNSYSLLWQDFQKTGKV